jgi:hypothetical protein
VREGGRSGCVGICFVCVCVCVCVWMDVCGWMDDIAAAYA